MMTTGNDIASYREFGREADIQPHDVDVAEQHAISQFQELPQDLEFECANGMIGARTFLRLLNLHTVQGNVWSLISCQNYEWWMGQMSGTGVEHMPL